jgi:flagellar protein FliL
MADEPEDIQVETDEPAQEPAEQAPGFSIGKLIEWLLSNLIPIIVAVVISTIIAFVLVRANVAKKSEEVYKTIQLAPKPAPLVIFPVEDFRVNTADVDEPHFIRVRMSLGYDGENKKIAVELPQRTQQIRDIILQILNSKEKQDIDEQQEKESLKQELIKAINNVLTTGEIQDIYFDEFVIS